MAVPCFCKKCWEGDYQNCLTKKAVKEKKPNPIDTCPYCGATPLVTYDPGDGWYACINCGGN